MKEKKIVEIRFTYKNANELYPLKKVIPVRPCEIKTTYVSPFEMAGIVIEKA